MVERRRHAVLLALLVIILQWTSDTVYGQEGIPSTPSNLGTSNVSSTFITLTWRHPSQENVDIFMVNFTFQIIGCPGDTGHRDDELSPSDTLVEGDVHQYNLTNVQEDSDYTFFVAAKNSVGRSSATSITRRTGLAGSSSPPRDVMITETTPTTVKVTWQRVRCVDRNADITNYVVQYVGVFESRGFSVPDDPREYTFTGLVPWTNYTIAVAAQHINLRENPPVFLIGAEQEVTASTLPVQELGLFHGGMLLPNNTVLSSVDQQGLFCLTTNTRCCEGNVSSHWFLPGRSDPVINIEEATSSDQYRVTRRPGAIALATKLTGIRGSPLPFARGVYTCRIPGANGGTQTLYAGVKLDPSIIISDLSFSDATNLVCTSTGRPVNSITWLRNVQVIDFETDSTFTSTQTLIDPVDAVYLNVLSSQNASSFVGTFTCRLTDAEESPTPVERALNVNDVTVSNDEFIVGTRAVARCTSSAPALTIDSITWTSPAGDILTSTDSCTLLELTFDPVMDDQMQGEYTCIVRRGEEVASQRFQVALIAPEEPLQVMILGTSGTSVAGSPFDVTCVVMERVPGLSNQPTATWLNSDREPVPTHQGASTSSFSNSTHAISVLSFQSLLVSQGSQYTCVGSLRLAFLGTDVSAEQPYRVVVYLPHPIVSIAPSGPHYLGERTTLTCRATALPQVDRGTIVRSFVWITEGEEVSDSSPGFEITQPSQLTSQLTIISLGVSDINFTCSATIHLTSNSMRVSPQASAFHAITLGVDCGVPTIPSNVSVVAMSDTIEGAVVTIQCEEGLVPSFPVNISCTRSGGEGQWRPDPANIECHEVLATTSKASTISTATITPDIETTSPSCAASTSAVITVVSGVLLLLVGLVGGFAAGTFVGCCCRCSRHRKSPSAPAQAAVYEEVEITATRRQQEIKLGDNVAYGQF